MSWPDAADQQVPGQLVGPLVHLPVGQDRAPHVDARPLRAAVALPLEEVFEALAGSPAQVLGAAMVDEDEIGDLRRCLGRGVTPVQYRRHRASAAHSVSATSAVTWSSASIRIEQAVSTTVSVTLSGGSIRTTQSSRPPSSRISPVPSARA